MKGKSMNSDGTAAITERACQQGMTLLEMLVAMAILSMIIYTVCHLYGFAYRSWADGMIAEQLQRQAQTAMNTMETDIKQAQYYSLASNTSYAKAINVTTTGANAGYEVIFYEIIAASDSAPVQVHFRLQQLALQNYYALQRGIVQPNASGVFTTSTPAQWTTLLNNVTTAGSTPPIFTITTTNPDHPGLSMATLTLKDTGRPNISIVFNPIFSLQGNLSLQGVGAQ
ncbi:MAG: prepilin-type N-terminal cleavage/methylation domain-containing protein [Thermacetogeniaceae bacterium]